MKRNYFLFCNPFFKLNLIKTKSANFLHQLFNKCLLAFWFIEWVYIVYYFLYNGFADTAFPSSAWPSRFQTLNEFFIFLHKVEILLSERFLFLDFFLNFLRKYIYCNVFLRNSLFLFFIFFLVSFISRLLLFDYYGWHPLLNVKH